MKERYRDWANLTVSPKKKRPALIRLIELPGVREVETRELLNSLSRVREDHQLIAELDELSRRHFGITEANTIFMTQQALDQIKRRNPEEGYDLEDQWMEHEEQFFCKPSRPINGQVSYLRGLGWDVTDDQGRPMRLLDRFARQIEAAEKRLCGAHLPNFDAIRNQNWENKIAEDARRFMSRKK